VVTELPTAVFLHAHPDDEALFTGARTLLGARAGQRQVLLTLTDGALGFDPEGRGALEAGHDEAATVAARAAELHVAADLLGFERSVQVGYRDSGMAGWPSAEDPRALVNQPLEEVVDLLVELLADEGPLRLITYGADGLYGHPDHVAAHAIASACFDRSPQVEQLHAVVMTAASVDAALERTSGTGEMLPEWLGRRLVATVAEAEVDLTFDAGELAIVKQAAVAAHRSQIDNRVLAELDSTSFTALFGIERYVVERARG
jgi:LmbE family N-acetylglucosaminyl deacetylase